MTERKIRAPFSNEPEDQLPAPTPEASVLLAVVAQAAMGMGTKEGKDRSSRVDHVYHVSEEVPSSHLKLSEASQRKDGAVPFTHLQLETVIAGGRELETNIAYDPNTGGFHEYTTHRGDFFAKPEVKKSGAMTPRRIRAAERLIKLRFGLGQKTQSPIRDVTGENNG